MTPEQALTITTTEEQERGTGIEMDGRKKRVRLNVIRHAISWLFLLVRKDIIWCCPDKCHYVGPTWNGM